MIRRTFSFATVFLLSACCCSNSDFIANREVVVAPTSKQLIPWPWHDCSSINVSKTVHKRHHSGCATIPTNG